MILAAAEHAEDPEGVPPPEELIIALQCERWNCLPEAGGLYDQPAGLVQRMGIAYNAWRAHKEWLNGDSERNDQEWAKMHPDWWQIILKVREMRRDKDDGR